VNYEGAINSEVVFARSDYFNGHLLGFVPWEERSGDFPAF